jgi:hypothetical protein
MSAVSNALYGCDSSAVSFPCPRSSVECDIK